MHSAKPEPAAGRQDAVATSLKPSAGTRPTALALDAMLLTYGPELGAPAKQMAFVAIYLHRTAGVTVSEALALAKEVVSRALGAPLMSLRKAASDARALLAYGRLGHIPLLDVPLPSSGEAATPLLARAVSRSSITKASRERAAQLQGARGGRRSRAHAKLNQEVAGLIRSALKGDPGAASKLEQIAAILRQADIA